MHISFASCHCRHSALQLLTQLSALSAVARILGVECIASDAFSTVGGGNVLCSA